MPKAVFALDGLNGLLADVARIGDGLTVRVEEAVETTAHAVQERARANAPQDRGDLIRSIAVEGRGLIRRVGLVDQDLPERGGSNRAHRNPSVYGVWYEYGFKTRNIPAHPFMGPAVDSQRFPHIDRLIDAINGAIG